MKIEIKLLDENNKILRKDLLNLEEVKKYGTLGKYVRANCGKFSKEVKFIEMGVAKYEIEKI